MTSALISSNLSSSFFPTKNLHRIRIPATSIPGGFNIRARRSKIVAKSLNLPLLPFSMSEVLVPTESTTLHLYEARYLALLEESMKRKKNMFVHFILDPISISETATEASFAARYGCLVLIENVERLDVGALVSIRGVGRVKISRFLGADPYLSGEVRPIQDRVNYESSNELTSKISQLKESIKNLNSLEIKLKAPADSPLQTRLINSLNWAEDEPPVEFDESFLPSLQERLSFSAFQPVSGFLVCRIDKVGTIKVTTREIKSNGYERYNREVRTLNGTHKGEHFLNCSQTRHPILGHSLIVTLYNVSPCKCVLFAKLVNINYSQESVYFCFINCKKPNEIPKCNKSQYINENH